MIPQSIYALAKRNIEQFTNAGPNDDEMAMQLIKLELKSRLAKNSEDYVAYGYVLQAISAAVIHRYEEQNNLHSDSPTTVDPVQLSTNPPLYSAPQVSKQTR